MHTGKDTQNLLTRISNILTSLTFGKSAIGIQNTTLTNSAVVTLSVPSGASEAWISVETASGAVSATVAAARYTISDTLPVTGNTGVNTEIGLPIFDTQPSIVIKGFNNLQGFKVIGANNNTRALKVIFFK